jgi:hypothetical protein
LERRRTTVADDNEPIIEETPEEPEVEAHTAAEVLDLQGISIDEASRSGFTSPVAGSCSSCVGSFCM